MKPPDTSLPTTLCFPGYIDLNDSGLSVQSVQAKPIFRVGRGQKQIVTIRLRALERAELVEGLGRMDAETGGRPAELFRFRREILGARPVSGLSLPLLRE